MEKKTISEMHVETNLICQKLESIGVGEFIKYTELSKIIGRNIQHDARHILESARRITQRDKRVLFECVRNEGLRRLNDVGIVGTTSVAVTKIRNMSRRGAAKVLCMQDIDALPKNDKDVLNARLSIMAMVSNVTKAKSIKLIESKVAETQERLPLRKTIEAFM